MSDSVKHDWKSCVLKMYREFESPTKNPPEFHPDEFGAVQKGLHGNGLCETDCPNEAGKIHRHPTFLGVLMGV